VCTNRFPAPVSLPPGGARLRRPTKASLGQNYGATRPFATKAAYVTGIRRSRKRSQASA